MSYVNYKIIAENLEKKIKEKNKKIKKLEKELKQIKDRISVNFSLPEDYYGDEEFNE